MLVWFLAVIALQRISFITCSLEICGFLRPRQRRGWGLCVNLSAEYHFLFQSIQDEVAVSASWMRSWEVPLSK